MGLWVGHSDNDVVADRGPPPEVVVALWRLRVAPRADGGSLGEESRRAAAGDDDGASGSPLP